MNRTCRIGLKPDDSKPEIASGFTAVFLKFATTPRQLTATTCPCRLEKMVHARKDDFLRAFHRCRSKLNQDYEHTHLISKNTYYLHRHNNTKTQAAVKNEKKEKITGKRGDVKIMSH
jgi:hypothetical protein